MAVIFVDGANDLAPPRSGTSIGVTGADFPPLSEAAIHIRHPIIHDTVTVGEDGRFVWARTSHPQLPDGSSIDAVVTTADGTKVEATGQVVGAGGSGDGAA